MTTILGIETTCDETGIAIVRDGHTILSNQVASQASVHEAFGGVFPEVASRLHVEALPRMLQAALTEAALELKDVDAIAVAYGPGLMGALLTGLQFAKGLAIGLHKPLVAVNHVEAHLFAAAMNKEPLFPALGVVVSGGHTALLQIDQIGSYKLLGQTIDDAIGESFDKVAIMLGLPYPGGAPLEKLALLGKPDAFPFRAGRVQGKPLDFSFSGLKTAVLQTIAKNPRKEDVAASFQEAAFQDLLSKARLAHKQIGARSLLLGGGVANNQRLRELLLTLEIPLFAPPPALTLDNAAMIAGLGYFNLQTTGPASLLLDASPRIAFDRK